MEPVVLIVSLAFLFGLPLTVLVLCLLSFD